MSTRSENIRETVIHYGVTLRVVQWRGKHRNHVEVSDAKKRIGFEFPKSVAFGPMLRNRAIEKFVGVELRTQ